MFIYIYIYYIYLYIFLYEKIFTRLFLIFCSLQHMYHKKNIKFCICNTKNRSEISDGERIDQSYVSGSNCSNAVGQSVPSFFSSEISEQFLIQWSQGLSVSYIIFSLITLWRLFIWWRKLTQVSFCLCYLLNAKKEHLYRLVLLNGKHLLIAISSNRPYLGDA